MFVAHDLTPYFDSFVPAIVATVLVSVQWHHLSSDPLWSPRLTPHQALPGMVAAVVAAVSAGSHPHAPSSSVVHERREILPSRESTL